MFLEIFFKHTTGIFVIEEILIWISAVLTIISGAIYIKEYWSYIDPSK